MTSEESRVSSKNDSEKQILKEAFALLDQSEEEVLSDQQLCDILVSSGMDVSLEEMRSLISTVNTEDPTQLDFEQFLRLLLPNTQEYNDSSEIALNNAFHFLSDERGTISAKEIQRVMKEFGVDGLTEQDVKAVFEQVCHTSESRINQQQFQRLFQCDLK